jgi:hypothetical protein
MEKNMRKLDISWEYTRSILDGYFNPLGPYSTHHPLTFDEAMCLGWIFHVTDAANTTSIQQRGRVTNAKGSGRVGRDSLHFMYHNDNGQGYIRMAEGITPPHHYKQAVYFVLTPEFIKSQHLFLTKNGVVLFYGDVPPTLACNVLRPGRGHMLPSSVTGGTGQLMGYFIGIPFSIDQYRMLWEHQ